MVSVRQQERLVLRLNPRQLIATLPGLFCIANLMRMLSMTSIPYNILLIVTGVIGIACSINKFRLRYRSCWLFFLLYMFTLGINCLVIKNTNLYSIAMNVLLFGIAFIMLIYPWSIRTGSVVFYVSVAMILYRLSISVSRRILISSSNYISVVMLLAVSFYYISIELAERKLKLIDLLPAALCFYISIVAEGRGGILSCAVLLMLLLLLYARTVTNKNAKRSILLIIVLFCISMYMYINNYGAIDLFFNLGKWRERGTDNSARAIIWLTYYQKAKESFLYFMQGAPLREIPLISAYGENTHSSFIQLHAYNGLIPLIVTVFLVLKAMVSYLRERKFVIAIMMLTVVIRGLSDKFIFGQYGMPLMLFFMFYPVVINENSKKKETRANLAN